jgi:hypothetical protein
MALAQLRLDQTRGVEWGKVQGWRGGLLGHCALVGCLLSLALEYLGAGGSGGGYKDVRCGGESCNSTAVKDNSSEGVWERTELGRFAAGGVDFLLLQSHFAGWASAARSGTFEVITTTSISAPAHRHSLSVLAYREQSEVIHFLLSVRFALCACSFSCNR